MSKSDVNMLLSFAQFDTPRTPKSKKMQVSYDQIIGGDLTESVKEMLKLGTQQRRLLVQGLSYAGTVPNPRNVIEAVNAYLPSVWKIQKSLEFSKDTKIKLLQPLHFEWSTSLSKNTSRPLSQSYGIFVFEVTFILMARALSHFNLARQLMAPVIDALASDSLNPNDEAVNEAFRASIAELRLGAGVIDYTNAEILGKWRKPPADPLPENRPGILKGLSIFYLVQVQKLFIAKAILTKKTNILPRLLLGLKNKAENCVSILFKESAGSNTSLGPLIDPEFINEMSFFSELCTALAYKYSALTLHTRIEEGDAGIESIEGAMGKVVGFSSKATAAYRKIKISGAIATRLGEDFKQEVSEVQKLYTKFQDENSSVYFGTVDMDECELPPRSQHVFNIKAEEFEMPDVDVLSFEQIIRAPPGINQKDFDAMPKDIQDEMLAEHKKKMEAQAAEEAAKNKKGWFGKKKSKNDKPAAANTPALSSNIAADLHQAGFSVAAAPGNAAPPGMDPSAFMALPKDIQDELWAAEKAKSKSSATPAASPAAAKVKQSGNKPVW